MTSPIREVAARLEPLASRKTDSELLALADAAEPSRARQGRRGGQGQAQAAAAGRGGPGAAALAAAGNRPAAGEQPRMGRFNSPEIACPEELQRKKMQFLAEEGVAMLVDPSTQGDGGTFFVQSATVPGAPLPVPGQTGGRRVSAVRQRRPQDHSPGRPLQGTLQPPGPDVRAGREGQDGRRPGRPVP